jgi:two-component system phosphate regulon sensor histidine kinase PhoR
VKSARNLYLTIGIIAACNLIVAGVIVLHCSGASSASRVEFLARYSVLIMVLCSGLALAGTAFLGWHWKKFINGMAEIIQLMAEGKPICLQMAASPMIKELAEAVRQNVKRYRDYLSNLEAEKEDLQLQIHLSQRQKKNTEAIIYGIRDVVIVVDEYNKLIIANNAAERLFGFDFKKAVHKPIEELVDESKKEFIKFWKQSLASKVQGAKKEIEFLDESRTKVFDCIASCVRDDRAKVCGLVAVLHDITREREISQMKTDFVSHVSHELKTPLASITAYSEMLVDGEADDEDTRKEFYNIIQSQAQRLNRLIEDILNTSRIESGMMKVHKENASLTILIEEQLQMIKSYADEKNIEIIGKKPIVFDQVHVDKDMISQVVVNLLSNAVKYTQPGGRIEIVSEVDESANIIRVSVTDTGVGIPEKDLDHVFDKFYRVEANKKVAKGTGLGLNLVKQIVEKVHNGKVFVKSTVGVGSTFGFELPLAVSETVEV